MTIMCMIITVTDYDHNQHFEMCIYRIIYIGKFSRYKIFEDVSLSPLSQINFRGWPFSLPLIIMERVFLKFRGCKQIHENSEIILPRKFPNIRYTNHDDKI